MMTRGGGATIPPKNDDVIYEKPLFRKLKILQASEEAIQAKMAMDRRYIGSLHPGMQRLLVSLTKRRNLLIDKYIFYIKFISHLQTNVLEL